MTALIDTTEHQLFPSYRIGLDGIEVTPLTDRKSVV